jgi:hypothetical protein
MLARRGSRLVAAAHRDEGGLLARLVAADVLVAHQDAGRLLEDEPGVERVSTIGDSPVAVTVSCTDATGVRAVAPAVTVTFLTLKAVA